MTDWDDDAIEDPEFRELSRSTLELAARIRTETHPMARRRRSVERVRRAARHRLAALFFVNRYPATEGLVIRFERWFDRAILFARAAGADHYDIARATISASALHMEFVAAYLQSEDAFKNGKDDERFVALRRLWNVENTATRSNAL